MSERLIVHEPAEVFTFLSSRLADWNRNTLRERLQAGCVLVNGTAVRRPHHALSLGDRVEVVALADAQPAPTAVKGLVVLYEDDHLIAIDKPPGLLSVSTERQRERTALALVRDALSRPGRPARLWPAHRLDRETSGVLLFARTREVCEDVRAAWGEASKTYLALVEGHPEPVEGLIDEPLWEDRDLRVHVGRKAGAREARTHYRTLERGRDQALLEVQLDTGRRHQIRAHLAWLGHPILGDRRYGTGARQMGLHALRLELPHPRQRTRLVLEAPAPRAFTPRREPRS